MAFPECLGRGPGARALPAESIGRVSPLPGGSARLPRKEAGPWALGNSEFGMWNSEFVASFFAIPHSALCIPHLKSPPVPWNRRCLMVSAGNALAPGPGTRVKATVRWCPLIIRFEQFTVFQASGSPGGHDFPQVNPPLCRRPMIVPDLLLDTVLLFFS